MKKIVLSLLLVIFMLSSTCALASADDDIPVFLDENKLIFDVQPQIINNRLMVPMRGIFEALGTEITWDSTNNTVYATTANTKITLKIGSKIMYKNDAVIQLDVVPQIISDRTMIPLRAVAEAFDANVFWHDSTPEEDYRYVHITTYDSYPELDIPKFDYICGEVYFDRIVINNFIVYKYPLAVINTEGFENDISDINAYGNLLKEYGYTAVSATDEGGMVLTYSDGSHTVMVGFLAGDFYGRLVAIGNQTDNIPQETNNIELFGNELIELQDYYFTKIDEYNDDLTAIANRKFIYDPDEDSELQKAMDNSVALVMQQAYEMGRGNTSWIEYQAKKVAEDMIPKYEERARNRFYQEQQNDYNYTVKMINNLINLYNGDVKELAIKYKISDYSSYLIK